jgi:tropinone reductase I
MELVQRWRLDGKRAIVTGGTRGIGEAVVSELRLLGAVVMTVARSNADINLDITEPDAPPKIVQTASETLGGLDILVNNVGTNVRKPTVDLTEADYAQIFATNLDAIFRLNQAAYNALKAQNGCIVQIGSVAGNIAIGTGAAYAMTKAALDQLTRYLAVEWAPDSIRVNSVNPWYTNTPLAAPVLTDDQKRGKILSATPLSQIAEPEDIAAAVAFLCLPAARHITGQCLAVDGGFLSRGAYWP